MHEFTVRVIYHELGTAISGMDVLCPDGLYHKCRDYIILTSNSRESVTERSLAKFGGSDVYDIAIYGPYRYS